MAEASLETAPLEPATRPFWPLAVLVRPRKALEEIAVIGRPAWFTALVILSLGTIAHALVAGWLRREALLSGGFQLPPELMYYPPEQQAQFEQALQAISGPVFIYVIPSMIGLARVWFGWIVVSGVVHFALTLLGGRGDVGSTVNVVAWAALPLALRDLVRAGSMLVTHQLIRSPGLSGFSPEGDAGFSLYVAQLLALVDIYLIWQVILMVFGGRTVSSLSFGKALAGVLLTMLGIVALQALSGYGIAQISSLKLMSTFF